MVNLYSLKNFNAVFMIENVDDATHNPQLKIMS